MKVGFGDDALGVGNYASRDGPDFVDSVRMCCDGI